MVLPALLFWTFLIPLVIFFVLYSKRSKLFDSEGLRIILGNFYNPYSQEVYYRGIVIGIFKMSIFILASILNTSDIVKGIAIMLVIHAYFQFFKRKPPYKHASLNKAEKFCCLAYMVVLTVEFVRMSVELEWIKKLCEVVVFISIASAGGYVVINVFWLYIMQAWGMFNKFVEKPRNLKEIMTHLANYHETERNNQQKEHAWSNKGYPAAESQLHRRSAISVDPPAK